MAISGAWKQATLGSYAGPLQWGTGYHPVHAVSGQDAPGRVLDPGDAGATPPPEVLLGPSHWGYCDGDYVGAADLMLRNVPSDHSGWDNPPARDRVPGNYPEWGPYGDPASENWDFPVSGPPGGTTWRRIQHRSKEEVQISPQVLQDGSNGGSVFQSKALDGPVSVAVESDPAQYVINTSDVQGPGKQLYANTRATARDTDKERAPITSRIRGQMVKRWTRNAASPDMAPRQQDIMFRPFTFRTVGASVPPPGGYTYMSGSQVTPVQRAAPPDPYQGVPETEVDPGGYGYTSEEGGWY